KVQWLQEKNMRIFYGDSDNDITAARDCGIRGIRILRAANSTYIWYSRTATTRLRNWKASRDLFGNLFLPRF
ncbi:hypothetical protein MJM25_29945, partial [Salmonella enterica subsp. enterica serovar Lubbock]|nr:hypothetical protein [Salmonella enterica subsp. enterica serovar Lubbock]